MHPSKKGAGYETGNRSYKNSTNRIFGTIRYDSKTNDVHVLFQIWTNARKL